MSRRIWPWAAVALVLGTALDAAASCSVDASEMDRGERRPVLICGAGIRPGYALEGLSGAGFAIDYQQYLRRCSPERADPGIFLWLRAGPEATGTRLAVRDPASGVALCDDLPIATPDRLLLPEATLRPLNTERSAYLLELTAPPGVDFSQACGSPLAFPAGPRWPQLTLLKADELRPFRRWRILPATPQSCIRSRIRAVVSMAGEQQFPAKVVVSNLGTGSGLREGIAFVQPPAPAWLSAMPEAAGRYVYVDGYRTRYFEAGRGPDTVILVHGGQPDPLSPTAEFWQPNFAALAARFHVIAFDMLGCGLTDNPRTADDYLHYYERAADHLYGLIGALGLKRVHLVGHSQGGWPVLRVALDHPDVVRSLVSVDSVMAPFTGDSGNRAVSRFGYLLLHVTPAGGPTVESLLREQSLSAETWNNLSWSDTEARLRFARLPKLGEAKAALAAVRMSPGHPAFRELRREALAELEAGRLQVPHLMIWGYQDPLAPVDLGLEYLRIASRGPAPTEFLVINQSGHSPQREHPAAFNAAVQSFIDQYRAGR